MDRYNIPKQTLSDWFKNYENYIATTKTNNYRLEGGGLKNKITWYWKRYSFLDYLFTKGRFCYFNYNNMCIYL